LQQLPVVPDLGVYRWSGLPSQLAHLTKLNALGWNQGDTPGERVLQTVPKLLSLVPFKRDCRLFISHRREDGSGTAQALYRHLTVAGYQAFLDTESLEGGDPVQVLIHQAIPERDFLLLVNSPTAHQSAWVREEVEVALSRRVTIFVLDLPRSTRMPLLRDLSGLPWDESDPDMALRVEHQVATRIAARASFDQRVRQTLHSLCRRLDLEQEDRERRRCSLRRGAQPLMLIDHEDAAHGLDRLYRLHQGYAAEATPPRIAILVHNGLPLSNVEREAYAGLRRASRCKPWPWRSWPGPWRN
jgi:hypothetical protein